MTANIKIIAEHRDNALLVNAISVYRKRVPSGKNWKKMASLETGKGKFGDRKGRSGDRKGRWGRSGDRKGRWGRSGDRKGRSGDKKDRKGKWGQIW